jgi:hypothetical protein
MINPGPFKDSLMGQLKHNKCNEVLKESMFKGLIKKTP